MQQYQPNQFFIKVKYQGSNYVRPTVGGAEFPTELWLNDTNVIDDCEMEEVMLDGYMTLQIKETSLSDENSEIYDLVDLTVVVSSNFVGTRPVRRPPLA
jgi:hypothetical protein